MSRARALLLAGKYSEGLDLSHLALAEAEGLGWPPMTAAARELEGLLLGKSGASAKAEAASLAAYLAAAKVRAWDVAAAAAIELVFNVGYRQVRHAEGKVWAGHAEVATLFAGDPLGLREAARRSNLAAIHQSSGAYAEATALYEQALGIYKKALGPAHPDVALSLNNLAETHQRMGAYGEAKALYARALSIWEKALGPGHANVAYALGNLGGLALAQGRTAEALPILERAVAIYDGHAGVQEGESENRFRLAQALIHSGGDRTRALAQAGKAAADFRERGAGMAKELATVEAFLAKHREVR